MRIIYLHQYFNTPEMSGGTRSFEMARRLVAYGHEVSIITSWRGSDERSDWFETNEAGIMVHWLPVPYSNHMAFRDRIEAFLKFAWCAAGKAASIPADIVFATSTPLTIGLPAWYAARRSRLPMVFEVRDLWPELPIAIGALRNPVLRIAALKLEKFLYRHSDRVVALSPGMKVGVVATGYEESRVHVIPNGSDLALFTTERSDANVFRSAHPELGQAPIVAYIGTIGEINGVSYVAHMATAAAELGLNLQFIVVGGGKEEHIVRSLAVKLGVLGKNFHMYSSVPKQEVPGILAGVNMALSLFVDLKPMWANSANKFFDALASGTPVAINYGGWQADLLQEAGAGLVIPPNSAVDAVVQIDKFVADAARIGRAGRMARSLAESKFSREILARNLEKVLQATIDENDGGTRR